MVPIPPLGRNLSTYSYYTALNEETGRYELRIEADPVIITEEPARINVAEAGKAVTLAVKARTSLEGTLKYQWYATDSYTSPQTNAVKAGTAATLKVTGKDRGIKYYYCEVTCGEEKAVSGLFAVVTPAKGSKAITDISAIGTYGTSHDALTTEGWKWNAETATLTLKNADIILPFSGGRALELNTGTTLQLEGTNYMDFVPGTSICITGDSAGDRLTVNGGGTLNVQRIRQDGLDSSHTLYITGSTAVTCAELQVHGANLTVDGAALNGTSLSTEDSGLLYTFKNNAKVSFKNLISVMGDIAADSGAEITAANISAKNIDVKDGAGINAQYLTVRGNLAVADAAVAADIYINAKGDMTIDRGGLVSTAGYVNMAYPYEGKQDRKLTVNGTLAIENIGHNVPFSITSTLETPVVTGGTARLIIPEGAVLQKESEGSLYYYYYKDGNLSSGKLLIAEESYAPAEITSAGKIAGTPVWNSLLTVTGIQPADATVSCTWQWSETATGPWKNIQTSHRLELSTRYANKYIRAVITGYATHSGTMATPAIGPVKGNPLTLTGLYGIGLDESFIALGSEPFNGNSFSYSHSSNARDDGTYTYIALPANEDATVTIRNLTTGFEQVGTRADVPVQPGRNIIEIEVAYNGQSNIYSVTHTVNTPEYRIRINTPAPGCTLTVTYNDENGTPQAVTLTEASADTEFRVVRGTEITVTSTTPAGTRAWCYGYGTLPGDFTKEGSPYTFTATEDEYIYLYASYVVALPPEIIRADWDYMADTLTVKATALEKEDDGYCIMQADLFDTEGNPVRSVNTASDAISAADGVYEFSFSALDSTEEYTLAVYNTELFRYQSDVPRERQKAIINIESRREIRIVPASDHIVLKPGETKEVAISYNGYVSAAAPCAESFDTAVLDETTAVYGDALRITAKAPGTAYITLKAADHPVNGEMQYVYAVVRVDVIAEDTAEKISLGTVSGTVNVYDNSEITVPVYNMKCGYEIDHAEFETAALNEKFVIEIVNDRTIRILPVIPEDSDDMDWAAWAKSMAGSYTSRIKVFYNDKANGVSRSRTSDEAITVKVANKAPAVKVSAIKLNSFYSADKAEIVYTSKGNTVAMAKVDAVKATAKTAACPRWLTLSADGSSALLNNAALSGKKASGKVALKVWLEGWRVPVQVSASVSVTFTAPKLKLDRTSITVPLSDSVFANQPVYLVSSDKKVPLSDIPVTKVAIAGEKDLALMSAKDRRTYLASLEHYIHSYDSETGRILINNKDIPVAGKIMLYVYIENGTEPVKLPLTVKTASSFTLKADKTKLTMSCRAGYFENDDREVVLTTNSNGYILNFQTVSVNITDSNGNICNDELTWNIDNGRLTFSRNRNTRATVYKAAVSAKGITKPIVITVTVTDKTPAVKLSSVKGTRNKATDTEISITASCKDADAFSMYTSNIVIVRPDGTEVAYNDCDEIYVWNRGFDPLEIRISPKISAVTGTYKIRFRPYFYGAGETENFYGDYITYQLKVIQTLPKIKLSTTAVTLNPGLGTAAENAVIKVTKPEDFRWWYSYFTIKDSKGKDTGSDVLDLYYDDSDRTIRVKPTAATLPGETYTVTFRYWLHSGTNVSVSAPFKVKVAKADRAVTAKGSVKGAIDLTRPASSAADITYKYTNWNVDNYGTAADAPVLAWKVYAMNGKKTVTTAEGALDDNGLVAMGDSTGAQTPGSWFENRADISGNPYGLKLGPDVLSAAFTAGNINPVYKYTVKAELTFPAADKVFVLSDVKLTVKQGTTKFALRPSSTVISTQDASGRVFFTLESTDKDSTGVADIAKVELVPGALANALEINREYSAGGRTTYSIGWKDSTVTRVKTGTVKIKVYLEGNSPARNKPNATLSLKVTVK